MGESHFHAAIWSMNESSHGVCQAWQEGPNSQVTLRSIRHVVLN